MRKIAWLMAAVLALAGCAQVEASRTVYVVPYSLTTLYGKTPAAKEAATTSPDGQAACAVGTIAVVVPRDNQGIEDSGQIISSLEWPDTSQKGGEIVLALDTNDGASVWSYRAVIGTLEGRPVGTPGGLLPLGVQTDKLIIRIGVGDNPTPDKLTLCRPDALG